MTTQAPKKKKQNIDRELWIGGGVMLLLAPTIATVMLWSLIGVVMGIVLLLFSDDVPATSAMMMTLVYSLGLAIFTAVLWRVSNRMKSLLQRKRDLQAEQERIDDLLDQTAAIERLQDSPIVSDDIHYQQKSPTEKSIRDGGFTS